MSLLRKSALLALLGCLSLAGPAWAQKAPPAPATAAETAPSEEPRDISIDPETAREIPYWRERLSASPEDVTVRLALGNAYALNGRLKEAVREYKRVVREYPTYKSAWNNLGSAYRALGKKRRALDAYQRAVKIDPRYALAYYNMGVVYDSYGHYEKALEFYGTAVKYDPKLLDPKKNPQVVNNPRVFAVLLHNYVKSSGNLALPLEPAFPLRQD